MAVYADFMVICGLSSNGAPVNGAETDWYHFGLPVHAGEIWEFQFQCMHKAGVPDATVIGSFVMYDNKGVYRGTTLGPVSDLVDSTSWQQYSFQYQFSGNLYVFPAIWWHSTASPTPLNARYIAGVQVAQVQSAGAVTVISPDVFLTLGAAGKTLASPKAILGPKS